MKRYIIAGISIVSVVFSVLGCKEKPKEPEITNLAPVPMKEESPSGITPKVAQPVSQPSLPSAEVSTSLVPSEHVAVVETAQKAPRPSEQEIQQALKNSGFYQGELDGKIGPKTKKAIEEFQAKNGLKVDGKVGPQTWEKLKEYLSASPEISASGIKN